MDFLSYIDGLQFSVHLTLYSVQCIVYSVQCSVHTFYVSTRYNICSVFNDNDI